MGEFKFFGKNQEDEFERLLQLHFPDGAPEGLDDDFPGLPGYDPELHGPLTPAVFVSLNINRNAIPDEQYQNVLKQQRIALIERMFEQGMVTQTIISQDDNGFTIRTELLNF